jgi:hypothetical protein
MRSRLGCTPAWPSCSAPTAPSGPSTTTTTPKPDTSAISTTSGEARFFSGFSSLFFFCWHGQAVRARQPFWPEHDYMNPIPDTSAIFTISGEATGGGEGRGREGEVGLGIWEAGHAAPPGSAVPVPRRFPASHFFATLARRPHLARLAHQTQSDISCHWLSACPPLKGLRVRRFCREEPRGLVEVVIRSMHAVAVQAFPRVAHATHAEWWAHCRGR